MSKGNFVLLSEEVAALLAGAANASAGAEPAGFQISAAGMRPRARQRRAAAKPSRVKFSAKVVTLSKDELKSRRAAGEMNRLVYPLIHYSPQYVSFFETGQPAPRKPVGKARAGKLAGGPMFVASAVKPAPAANVVTVDVVCDKSKKPLSGVPVYVYETTSTKSPECYLTNKQGRVSIPVIRASVSKLVAVPEHSHWSKILRNVRRGATVRMELQKYALNGAGVMGVTTAGNAVKDGRGAGVRIAVIDTGVGPHKDVRVTGGRKVLVGVREARTTSYEDSSFHGTHVAGIIVGNSKAGMKGIAPDAELYAYRVVPHGEKLAPNQNVIAAIMQAVSDGCHIINLSLGAPKRDPLVKKALDHAEASGVLVVAAAGNKGDNQLLFPAAEKSVVSVSALGCSNTYPKDSIHTWTSTRPAGLVKSHFIAKFSNYGTNLVCTSGGVAVISTIPGGKYLAMDGTSMAAPMVSAVAACLLSARANEHILQMPSDRRRSQALRKMLYTSCRSLGFTADKQGRRGLPS